MEVILSVGIDIGTTTSQIIFSKLTIRNDAVAFQIPRIAIVDKEIWYKSDIYITPLVDNKRVDENKLADIIRREYNRAGVKPSELTVGAVIITGESSRKENARELVHSLGTLAGDFVVASAGPDLEGILAGKGCGAAVLSQKRYGLVANIDIGGGTSNIALFDNGFPVDTACLDIGGRQIRFAEGSDVIEYVAPRTKELCKKMGLSLGEGKKALPEEIEALCKRYTEILMEALGIFQETPDRNLMMTDHPLLGSYQIQYLTFSGGVADLYYNGGGENNPYIYNDIGVFFSRALKKYLPEHVKVLIPEETIRATVIGAGAFTATLSGSTIDIAKGKLPVMVRLIWHKNYMVWHNFDFMPRNNPPKKAP